MWWLKRFKLVKMVMKNWQKGDQVVLICLLVYCDLESCSDEISFSLVKHIYDMARWWIARFNVDIKVTNTAIKRSHYLTASIFINYLFSMCAIYIGYNAEHKILMLKLGSALIGKLDKRQKKTQIKAKINKQQKGKIVKTLWEPNQGHNTIILWR